MIKHVIITPVFNEEDKIEDLIQSLISQTLLPTEWIVVDDGSTDRTAEIVKDYSLRYPWIRLVTHIKNSTHSSGSKIAKACIFGYGQIITPNFNFVTKIDADLIFPAGYFEQISNAFLQDENLGLCGGVCVMKKKDELVIERVADKDHVRGALKSYRKNTYELIGGIRPIEGWDTLDELLVLYHGKKVKVFDYLHVIHKRETDTHTNVYKVPIKSGKSFYKIGYNFLVAFISSAKMGIGKPMIISTFLALYGYFYCFFTLEKRETTISERKFINSYRLKKAFQKLKLG